MEEVTKVVRIQPTASGPVYQVTITMQSTPNHDYETHLIYGYSDDSARTMKPDMRKKITDPATTQASGHSRDDPESAKNPEVEHAEMPTDYEAFVGASYGKNKEEASSEKKTPDEQINNDGVHQDMTERRLKSRYLLLGDDKEDGRQENTEDEEAIIARMDAEMEEMRTEVEKLRIQAEAAFEELSHCDPCGLRIVSLDLIDDPIRVGRARLTRVT
ncbi:hypothetical protein BKA65DRAFT_513054 [Rhexocercosporidium sp. MPI-PUGE-AT-0058]|nr:hypothetical protein BKA65DRAFT_513054 [Rhexocercosporidium sp. MPI-PUGE-AT-0058]